MKIETGNLDGINKKYPKHRGWVVGDFISTSTLRHSTSCEIKWIRHPKKDRKLSGKKQYLGMITLVVLISGKFQMYFPTERKIVLLAKPADYVIFEGIYHEGEALENSNLIVVRWHNDLSPSFRKKI